jgi:hypothetical protein
MNKEFLITSGYPRSGNMFLNHSLRWMYFPEDDRNGVDHMTITIKNREKTLVTIRKPEESIVSWHLFKHKVRHLPDLDSDINFYIRYHAAVKENINKCIVMEFDQFTNSSVYIEDKIYNAFNISKVQDYDLEKIKDGIMKDELIRHLPGDNYTNREEIKNNLINHEKYSQCLDLYNYIVDNQ